MDTGPCPKLDALVSALEVELALRPRGPGVAALLESYAAGRADWPACATWSPARYTRNLIARRDDFELLLLCWGAGQESPIHNHEDQSCWMAVLEGEIEEVQYAFPAPSSRGPLSTLRARVYPPGEVAFIRDEIGLHRVRGHAGQRAVSLHVYAAPYEACNVYCPDTGKVERVRLAYHSIRGELVPG
jgi:cysteine dioxygenase